MRNLLRKRIRRGLLVAIGTGGLVFASSCGAGVEAITAGLSAAARTLDQNQQDENISLGNWLVDEFRNL